MSRERGGTLTREFRIAELLEEIHRGRIVLPEFQRDFDWNDERVMQLLATVARRWPAGSLLLQDFPGETFYKLRSFEGGPAVVQTEVDFVVLDGQQRLTALYHAVYDTGPYIYAIHAQALIPETTIDLLEEAIKSFTREEWDAVSLALTWNVEGDWVPFYALRSAADFFGWRDDVIARSPSDDHKRVREQLSDAYRHGLEAFHTYQLPAVIVERELEAAAVARIFERVNQGGLKLSAFDLMVAKTFDSGWNLREKWESARNEYGILDEFLGDDGMLVIRVIALKAKSSVREGDVLRLGGLAVRHDWDRAVDACAKALTFLREHCGVLRPEWLPYGGIVVTLAALAFEHDLDKHTDVLVSWFLGRSFGLRYETGANTVTVEEHDRLSRVLTGVAELDRVPITGAILREATRKRRSAIWRAFMCSLKLNGALDPITGDAPVHPRDAYVLPRDPRPEPDTESAHLLVLNLLLVDASSVGQLMGEGASTLRERIEELGDSIGRSVASSQMLPARLSDVPDELIGGRLMKLDEFLEDRMGYGLTVNDGA